MYGIQSEEFVWILELEGLIRRFTNNNVTSASAILRTELINGRAGN